VKRRFFIATGLSSVLAMGVKGKSKKRPPNIILVMADDVSWECFGCYGAEDYRTPNIDALAAGGIRFTHCYSTPLCTPSRVKIMTGKYNFRNYTYFGYLDPKEKTFGHLLKDAGYKTAIAGKWQLNGLYHKAKDCMDNTRPFKAGFDEYCLWQVTVGKSGPEGGERYWSPPLEKNGKFLTKKDNNEKYGPDIMSDFVCNFIERNKAHPFFVYYPMLLVHDPFVPTPDTIGDRPRTHEMNKISKGRKIRKKKDIGKQENFAQKENFVAMVNYMDKIVGKIVRKVKEIGQLENTIILFTADNGTNRKISSRWNGMNIQGGKGSTKDMGTHVPLVAYWKGHTPKGMVCDDLIDFTDFYPTLAEAAGIRLGKNDPIDGRSFLPQLKGERGNPRDWVLCHYQPYWGNFQGRQYVRSENFKLYRDGSFYEVPVDLKEEHDLAEGEAGERGETARRKLAAVLEIAPPPPPEKGGRNATYRPTYPNWRNILNPND